MLKCFNFETQLRFGKKVRTAGHLAEFVPVPVKSQMLVNLT